MLFCFAEQKWVVGPVAQMGADDWTYLKRKAEVYFLANRITDAKEMANKFLYMCGDEMLRLYDASEKMIMVHPETREPLPNSEYESLIATLDKHFERQRNQIYEVHKLRQMKQEESESLETFIVKLRTQAAKCGYQGSRLDEELTQMLVEGTRSSALRDKLLTTPMTLEEAIRLGKVFEDSKTQARAFSNAQEVATVNRVGSGLKKGREGRCFACGMEGHKAVDVSCPAKRSQCFKCGQTGHYARCCRKKTERSQAAPSSSSKSTRSEQKPTKRTSPRSDQKPAKRTKSNYLIRDAKVESESEDDQWKHCFMVGSSQNKLEFLIGSVPVKLFVDSGAEVSIMSIKTWNELLCKGLKASEIDHSTKQKVAGIAEGAELRIVNSFMAEVQSGQFVIGERFYVADNAAEDILSSHAAKQLHCLIVGYNVFKAEEIKVTGRGMKLR